MHTIKPLDTELVDKLSRQRGAIVTAEDHSVIGGLGGVIVEHVVSSHPVPIEKIGVNDRFGESAQAEEMLEMMGLNNISALLGKLSREGLKHCLDSVYFMEFF